MASAGQYASVGLEEAAAVTSAAVGGCREVTRTLPMVVDVAVNAFKARLDKFWKHQSVKFDFTADLTGTGNRSEEVIK